LFSQCHGVAHVRMSSIMVNIASVRPGLLAARTTASGHSEEAHEQDRPNEPKVGLFLEAHEDEDPFVGPTTCASVGMKWLDLQATW
jgi:hypothetical protein